MYDVNIEYFENIKEWLVTQVSKQVGKGMPALMTSCVGLTDVKIEDGKIAGKLFYYTNSGHSDVRSFKKYTYDFLKERDMVVSVAFFTSNGNMYEITK